MRDYRTGLLPQVLAAKRSAGKGCLTRAGGSHLFARRFIRPQVSRVFWLRRRSAMRELTPTQADDLYELINERAGRSLILTSNRSPVDWYPLFPNPVVAESLLDRLINNSHQLLMASHGQLSPGGTVYPPGAR